MKKIFPFLLIALTVLALGHFFKIQSSKSAKGPVVIPLQDSILKNRITPTSDALVLVEKNLQEKVVNVGSLPLDVPAAHVMGLHEKVAAFYFQVPRKSSLADVTASEMHETPQPVLEAGRHLGNMHEYFSTHDHDVNVELNFYLKCSQQKDFFDSVRALCAARASKLFLKITGSKISSKIFDDRIATLKDQITL